MVTEKNGGKLLESLPDAETVRSRLSEISQERQALEKLLGVINRRDKLKQSKREVAAC